MFILLWYNFMGKIIKIDSDRDVEILDIFNLE